MLWSRILSFLLACVSMLSYSFTLYAPPKDAEVHLPAYKKTEPDASMSCGIETCVRDHGGVPTLFVNGKAYPSAAYMTYLEPYGRYEQFADAGYTFFSLPALFATRWISVTEGLTPFAKGFFDDRETPDFSWFDTAMHRILDACPDALVFPLVNLSMPMWWI